MTEHEAAAETGLTIDILRGTPNDAELAALMAVVSEAYTSEAAAAVVEVEPARSAWSLSQRGLREPLRREWGWARG
ncbi:acyl-CoA carboxylase subunit epsilon [Microbacterium marmarense]|uniref:Acyl-CoA carboxylase subunit epsilon n=1 Tax=Microbacterium marmarense TaxID=3122051 RepID=A0ABU8LVF4_9MICO